MLWRFKPEPILSATFADLHSEGDRFSTATIIRQRMKTLRVCVSRNFYDVFYETLRVWDCRVTFAWACSVWNNVEMKSPKRIRAGNRWHIAVVQ